MSEMVACPECDGDQLAWDDDWCGDAEHCSPMETCPRCDGLGEVPADE